MILTLKIELLRGAYAYNAWVGTIEIDASSTLEELHLAIQEAVDFDNDHLYEFYLARTERSRERICFGGSPGGFFEDDFGIEDEVRSVYETTLEEVFALTQGKSKLFYLFDFGDSWRFKITKSRKAPQEPEDGVEYPRLVSFEGQTPEQYPGWDEDEDENEGEP